MGFQYTIKLVADGQYGGQLEDGRWTGLVGDLIERVGHSTSIISYLLIFDAIFRELRLQWLH